MGGVAAPRQEPAASAEGRGDLACDWMSWAIEAHPTGENGGEFGGPVLLDEMAGAIDELNGAVWNHLGSDRGERELITQFYVDFGTWLRATHPDVFEATYITSPDLPQPLENDHIDTLESRAQWATVLDEFLTQSDIYPLGG